MRDKRIFDYSIKAYLSIDDDVKERQLLERKTLYENILLSVFESMDSSFTRVFVIYYINGLYKIGNKPSSK